MKEVLAKLIASAPRITSSEDKWKLYLKIKGPALAKLIASAPRITSREEIWKLYLKFNSNIISICLP